MSDGRQSRPLRRRELRSRRGAKTLLAAAVAALHLLALRAIETEPPAVPEPRRAPSPVVVRSLPQLPAAPRASVTHLDGVGAMPPTEPAARRTVDASQAMARHAAPPPAAKPRHSTQAAHAQGREPAELGPALAPRHAAVPAPPAAHDASGPPLAGATRADASGQDVELPIYPTRPPASQHLRYRYLRGGSSGLAELSWQIDGGRYELRLMLASAGQPALEQSSRGAIDAAGLAPERFIDRQLRRGAVATNFRRDQRLITFSSSRAQLPLPAGAQDRLSWIVQLAAIAEAAPQPLAAGSRLAVFVAGKRGGGGVWAFDVIGAEALPTPSASAALLKLVREPIRPYDTRVVVWLDPARHHLPARAELTHPPGHDMLELSLVD